MLSSHLFSMNTYKLPSHQLLHFFHTCNLIAAFLHKKLFKQSLPATRCVDNPDHQGCDRYFLNFNVLLHFLLHFPHAEDDDYSYTLEGSRIIGRNEVRFNPSHYVSDNNFSMKVGNFLSVSNTYDSIRTTLK